MIKEIDDNKNGMIEFAEFLQMVNRSTPKPGDTNSSDSIEAIPIKDDTSDKVSAFTVKIR